MVKNNILITGGSGFIGSHVVRRFVNQYQNYHIYNLDNLSYSGNLENLKDIESRRNYTFIKADINDANGLNALFEKHKFDSIIHLAAESHVDRSIKDPLQFAKTNILGTINLLESYKKYCFNGKGVFYHISTDEVYGSLGKSGYFVESSSYDPHSPYSASKASSDHFVRAYGDTYKLPYIISNCSNNYGPNQFPEKLIPLFINNIINRNSLPVYGDGNYTRDWLFVEDHARAIDVIFHRAKRGETFNIGGFNEWKNIDLVKLLCDLMDEKLGRKKGDSAKLIRFVKDRPGHDFRYAIDASKLKRELSWSPSLQFKEGLAKTVDWYLNNKNWLQSVTSGEYQKYYSNQYEIHK